MIFFFSDKMGLLTSPTAGGSSKKFATVLIKWEPLFSPLLYLGGIIWFLALAYYPYNAGEFDFVHQVHEVSAPYFFQLSGSECYRCSIPQVIIAMHMSIVYV